MEWGKLIVGQLEFYWEVHLWPRLQGLTDEEYLWEPVENCWSIRPGPDGRLVADLEFPEPRPSPVTTIAWRMMHLAIGAFASRAGTFFNGGTLPDDIDMFDPRHRPADLPATADDALAYLQKSYRWWHDGIAALSDEELARPLGPKGGPFAEDPMAGLVIHINREVMHHGAEICLLRDLYRDRATLRTG